MRTHLHAYARRIYMQTLRTGIGLESIGPLIQLACLICDFCSSGQRFACGFLQIPPRNGHLAVRLTIPTVGFVGDFHSLVTALPGAPKEKRQVLKPAASFCNNREPSRARTCDPLIKRAFTDTSSDYGSYDLLTFVTVAAPIESTCDVRCFQSLSSLVTRLS